MVWELWQRSKALRCKPSDLVGDYNSIEAFYFDRAVWRWASAVDYDIETAADNAGKGKKSPEKFKQQARLKVLEKALKARGQPQKYKDPALGFNNSPDTPAPKTKPKGINLQASDGDMEIVLDGFG